MEVARSIVLQGVYYAATLLLVLIMNIYIYTHREVVTWGAGRFGQLGNNAQQDSIDLQHIAQSIPADAGKVIQVRLRCVCFKAYVFP